MKREKRHELLKEFIERDFTEDEILDILSTAAMYRDYRKKWLEMPKEYEKTKNYWKYELERTLEVNALDYSVGDFIDED